MKNKTLVFSLVASTILPLGLGTFFLFAGAANSNNLSFLHPTENKKKTDYKETYIKSYLSSRNSSDLDFSEKTVNSNVNPQPKTNALSAIAVSLNNNAILFAKDYKRKLPIASLTKMMTAVVALEHQNLKKEVIVSQKAANIGENVMGISEGETYTLEELLYGLFLHSGNDASYAIAGDVAETSEVFTSFMNFKAKELNLTDTHFSDPSGLDDNNQSTAYDLAKLTKYALQNPDFKRIVATVNYVILSSEKHKYLPLSNQTNLLTTYPGVKGVKTGYTEKANMCLITYAENNGQEIIGVVLGSNSRKADMVNMLDFSYQQLGIKIHHPLLDL
ncbi:MAG: hypothetical protein AAB443_03385 [Patescibacteria group bacterium]